MRITKSVLINRPVEVVWAFVTDLRNTPNWTRSGSELRLTSEGPPQVGATVEGRRRLFRRFDIKTQGIVISEYEPNHAFSIDATVPLMGRANQRLLFEPVAGGTRLTRSGDLKLRRIIQPLVPRLIGSVWTTELANLKRLIEGAG